MKQGIIHKILQSFRTVSSGTEGKFIYPISDVANLIPGSGVTFQTNCYNYCPQLQSILDKKSRALLNGKLMPVDSQGNVIKSAGFDKAMKVLDKPNAYNTLSEFLKTIDILISVYGVCYIYKVVPVGFSNVSSLIILPNSAVNVVYKSYANILANESIVDTYYLSLFGKTYMFRGEDANLIVEIRDCNPNLEPGMAYKPYSRLDSLEWPISNLVASLESRNQIIVKRGADILLSPDPSVDKGVALSNLDDPAKKKIQEDYERYGSLSGQWHALILNTPMKAQQITRDAQKLGLFEGEDSDLRSLLRAYSIPSPIMGLKDDAKYNTYAEAKTELYEDCIMPDAKIICEGLDRIFDATKNGFSFYLDYSHLQCMQRSEKDKADALNTQVQALSSAIESGLLSLDDAKNNLKDYLS